MPGLNGRLATNAREVGAKKHVHHTADSICRVSYHVNSKGAPDGTMGTITCLPLRSEDCALLTLVAPLTHQNMFRSKVLLRLAVPSLHLHRIYTEIGAAESTLTDSTTCPYRMGEDFMDEDIFSKRYRFTLAWFKMTRGR